MKSLQGIRRRRGFTLTELLVAVTIIAMIAAMAVGGLQFARQEARLARTKATVAKLNQVISERYESYMTRRVPVDLGGLSARNAAEVRLTALRYLMMMEMPERINDLNISNAGPIAMPHDGRSDQGSPRQRRLPWSSLALRYAMQYQQRQPTAENIHAEMLFMIVTMGNPEDRELFIDQEIGDTDNDGWMEFLDGWGKPIYFLCFAPGYSGFSALQSGNPQLDHDPFDTRKVQPDAFHLVPLIYSAGPDKKYGINVGQGVQFRGNPFADLTIGSADPGEPGGLFDNITNHSIEQR